MNSETKLSSLQESRNITAEAAYDNTITLETANNTSTKQFSETRDETRGVTRQDAHNALSGYLLEEQIGYLLRLVNQRHLEIFNKKITSLTPMQFSVLVRLLQKNGISQNELGRQVGMDAATTKGVIERLIRKNFVTTQHDANDKRRLCLSLTEAGCLAVCDTIPLARQISRSTLSSLSKQEASQLIGLLQKIQQAPSSH